MRPGPYRAALISALGSNQIKSNVIILAAGQSNEQSTTLSGQAISSTLDQDGSGRILQFRTDATNPTAGVQPFTWPANNSFLGPTRAFAMAQALLPRLAPGRKIYIIPAAVGGTKLYGDTWAAPSGTLYSGAKTALTNLLALIPGAKVLMSWTQGEEDANQGVTAAQYTTAFTAMLAGFRSVAGAENMVAFIHQMVPERFLVSPAELPARIIIDEAHKALPLTIPNCHFIGSTLGYQIGGDPSHFTAPGQRLAGQRAATALDLPGYWNRTIPPAPGTIADAGSGRISFTAANPPAPAYRMETRVAGSGGAWAAVDAFASLYVAGGDTVTLAVPGQGDTEVRISAKSYAGLTAPSNVITVALPTPPWYLDNAIFDLDYEHSRFVVLGTEYASLAAMVTAGVLTQSGGIDRYPIASMPSSFTLAAKGTTAATTPGATGRYLCALDDGTDGAPADELVFFAQSLVSGTPNLSTGVFHSGTSQIASAPAFFSVSGAGNSTECRFAARFITNDFVSSINGGANEFDNVFTIPSVNQLVIGNRDDGARPWGGAVKRVALLSVPLSGTLLPTLLA